MYSAKRAALMSYLPTSATFNPDTKQYNVLDQFVTNLEGCDNYETSGTAEYESCDFSDSRTIPGSRAGRAA